MKLFKDCWVALLEVFNAITILPTDGTQQSLGFGRRPGHGKIPHYPFPPENPAAPQQIDTPPSVFQPPSHGQEPESSIVCDYSAMGSGWSGCSTPSDRGCWLTGPRGERFDINTDYEREAPQGVTRKYVLDARHMNISADGVLMKWGKVFNQKYPGPWIQACWGDEVEIKVINNLEHNGTTVHWHGIRMLNSFEHDGVNAVTQCPIAPGDHFTYKFKTLQYGTSWYHSHYSLQYGDGMLGPLTIHGPATAHYDEAIDPILMTDWNHESAFMSFQTELGGSPPKMDSILLNGHGSYAGIGNGGKKYTLSFEYGKKYLLRLINTSVDTTFVFSIDNHWLKVITTDFVPIHNYTVDHVVVGIGQRYHVIVEAKPYRRNDSAIIPDSDTSYWIRTIPAEGCHNFMLGGIPDERQGILNYRDGSEVIPRTERGKFSIACRDELYKNLVPYHPWNITLIHGEKGNDGFLTRRPFEVGTEIPQPGKPLASDIFTRWSMGKVPMYLDFSEPTINHLKEDPKLFAPDKVVVPEDYPEGAWIYMVISGGNITKEERQDVDRKFLPGAHPMHLHGHDFALLQQSNETWTQALFKPKLDNPPRRDVVLLPSNGFIVIGFKADNPGAWALHCHIAWHASSGLAIQVLERQNTILERLAKNPERLVEIDRTCTNWKKWFSNSTNYWDSEGGPSHFQDDSGV